MLVIYYIVINLSIILLLTNTICNKEIKRESEALELDINTHKQVHYLLCCSLFNPFVPEFIFPGEPLNARDKMAAHRKYTKRAHNATSIALFRP